VAGKYYWSQQWRLETHESHEIPDPFLENDRGGRISLDETVKRVLEFADSRTFEEIDQRKLVSRPLLDILLKVFTRIGVLKEETAPAVTDSPVATDAGAERPLKKEPPVSVVIVNYNGDSHLPGLLESLHRQTYSNLEVIVVDNSSTDNSCVYMKENHPGVQLKELKRNIGFAAAVNTGIREAAGEYILVLNNDIVVDDNAIYELVKAALSGPPNWSAVVPKMKFLNNPAFINAIGNSMYPITWGSDNFIGHVDFGQFDHYRESFSACFGAVLLNRAVIEKIGMLDPRYRFYYEDMDWSFRAQAYGYPIITAPRADIYHKFGASMSSKSQAFKTRFIVGNRLYFTLKNLSFRTIKRFLPGYLLEDIKSTLIYLKRGALSMVFAYFRSYMRFIVSLPRLLFKRRKLQKQREVTDDSVIFARTAPLNLTLMERGVPRLDVFSLRTNYGFLGSFGSTGGFNGSGGEVEGDRIIWRLRPPRKNGRSGEKIYMEFSFHLEESGYYDIYLLGLIRRGLMLYLDSRPVNHGVEEDKGDGNNNALEMNYLVARDVHISGGSHALELERRNHVHAVMLKKKPRTNTDKH
jgi:GT2 family glycosyltransferase